MEDCQYLVLSNLDEIAWLLNMRGNDIDYNPYFYSYMLLHYESGKFQGGTLFMRNEKISEEIDQYLKGLGISILEYDDFYPTLNKLQGKVSVDLS